MKLFKRCKLPRIKITSSGDMVCYFKTWVYTAGGIFEGG